MAKRPAQKNGRAFASLHLRASPRRSPLPATALPADRAAHRARGPHAYIMPESRFELPLSCPATTLFQSSLNWDSTLDFRLTIDLAGSRPLGQQLVQFMIPWQR